MSIRRREIFSVLKSKSKTVGESKCVTERNKLCGGERERKGVCARESEHTRKEIKSGRGRRERNRDRK